MLDEIIIGLIGGIVGEKLFGKWSRRHPRLTMLICVPPIIAVIVLAGLQILRESGS